MCDSERGVWVEWTTSIKGPWVGVQTLGSSYSWEAMASVGAKGTVTWARRDPCPYPPHQRE